MGGFGSLLPLLGMGAALLATGGMAAPAVAGAAGGAGAAGAAGTGAALAGNAGLLSGAGTAGAAGAGLGTNLSAMGLGATAGNSLNNALSPSPGQVAPAVGGGGGFRGAQRNPYEEAALLRYRR